MLRMRLYLLHKRQNPEQLASLPNEAQHISKKQKRNNISELQYPPRFWDNLSEVDLTKRALRELDRRNKQDAWNSSTPNRLQHKPITRHARAELKDHQHTHPPTSCLSHCGVSSLKDIKQFARGGGPDLCDLRNFPKPVDPLSQTMSRSDSSFRNRVRGSTSASNSQLASNTATTKSTGPYNRNFQQKLIDGGVYPDVYEYPNGQTPDQPANWDEISRRLLKPRSSLSPSRFTIEDFRSFKRANAHASKEKQVATSVIPVIEGNIKDTNCVSGGIPFTNLDHLTDGTLVPGNPDLYYGARPEQLNRQVRDELGGDIIPSTQENLPIVPNFFLAAKGPDGSAAVAKLQACYDGALGARGMHSLLLYGHKNLEPGDNAYTFTSTYHDGTLKIYTTHCAHPTDPSSQPEYYMHQLRGWSMTSDLDTFRQGATAYRNARDLAKEQRDRAIEQANAQVGEQQSVTLAINTKFGNATSFTSEDTLDGNSAIAAFSKGSQAMSTEDANTTICRQDSTSPLEEVLSEGRAANKRSNRKPMQSLQSQRK